MAGEQVSAEGELVRELRESAEAAEAKRAMAQRELEATQRVLDETTRQRDLSLATLRHNGLDIDHDLGALTHCLCLCRAAYLHNTVLNISIKCRQE